MPFQAFEDREIVQKIGNKVVKTARHSAEIQIIKCKKKTRPTQIEGVCEFPK